MKIKKTYRLLVTIITLVVISASLSFQQNEVVPVAISAYQEELINVKPHYIAGETIVLKSSSLENNSTYLYVSSSYGNTIISSEFIDGQNSYMLPQALSNKSGTVTWKLFQNQTLLDSGTFHIAPNTSTQPVLEAYLGPPSIIAGGKDFTMLVVAATDKLDNLVRNGNEVSINEQFGTNRNTHVSNVTDRIAWKRIYSPNKSGRISVAAAIKSASTKEMVADVFPDNASNFTISENRVHPYADGNQIAVFETSEIKDIFGNRVSDGTKVVFRIEASDGSRLQTSANTIGGIASAKLLHPDIPLKWEVKAFVTGFAESEELIVDFKPIIDDFEVLFSEDNRTITVGPIRSYMNQIIPDGVEVNLSINTTEPVISKSSENGFVVFNLSNDFYEDGLQNIHIKVLGISKSFKKELD